MAGLSGRTVVVTGATGGAGAATVRDLRAAGADVVATGRDADRLGSFVRAQDAAALENETATALRGDVVDLTDEAATRAWASEVRSARCRRRGDPPGRRLARGPTRSRATRWPTRTGCTSRSCVTTQHVTLAFFEDLVASTAGRFAIVSTRQVSRTDRRQRRVRVGKGGRRGVDPGAG